MHLYYHSLNFCCSFFFEKKCKVSVSIFQNMEAPMLATKDATCCWKINQLEKSINILYQAFLRKNSIYQIYEEKYVFHSALQNSFWRSSGELLGLKISQLNIIGCLTPFLVTVVVLRMSKSGDRRLLSEICIVRVEIIWQFHQTTTPWFSR